MTWRGLYASSNGWRGLRAGCFEMLALPCRSDWDCGYPAHCILDGQELGCTGAAGGSSELLVVDTSHNSEVTLCSSLYASELLPCMFARNG